ncbi:sensor histidine kinase [Microcella sp.]|uniref:sensor histidine kinase n=1 Tax=Microcella sp. TaxID=1913979 RepID=UPI00391C2D66
MRPNGDQEGEPVPLGLPPHLAARTTSTAIARAGHAAAAVCLTTVGLVVVSIQAYLPRVIVWPALVVLIPMVVLLVLLERSPSSFVAVSYLAIGGLCVAWFSLIASTQLDTPVANDDFTIVLLKLALILVIGVGPSLGLSMAWTTAAYLVGELASVAALIMLGGSWRFDSVSFAVWFIVVGLLAVLRTDLLAGRDSQSEIYRAARDEMLADVRRVFEQRATALLHDTVLNQLAVITTTTGDLSATVRAAIRADLETIVGQEWFDVAHADDGRAAVATLSGGAAERAERLRTTIDDAAGADLRVELSGDTAVLAGLDTEGFDEFSRAIGQCIANVRRHAGTDSADVVLGGGADEVSAMVIDGGRGFALDARTDGRLGVGTSIVGRLETIGGSATVWSQPGKGTSVLLRVPAARPAALRADPA